ncbi:MAG: OPT family oligopeptide transporter [Polyangiaceae bacterium]
MTGGRQLTLRAAVAGMALGGVLCLSNLYVVLKTGWSLGVTITATLVAFAAFRGLQAVFGGSRFGPLESVSVASIASSGAWMTGGGNMAALPALLLLTGERPSGWAMVAWFALIASLGVVVAIPLRRQFLERERLPFPMSVATAESIRAMHATGDVAPARRLLRAALGAGVFTLLRDAKLGIPSRLTFAPLSTFGFGLDASVVLLGGGSLMRPRTAWSMVLGAVVTSGLLAPIALAHGLLPSADFKAIVQLSLWPAAAMLTTSALTSFALQFTKTLRSARAPFEVDRRWLLAFFGLGAPLVVLMWRLFGIPLWAGLAAMPLAALVGMIGARVTGETDITPTKAMGPLTQLLFGAALPGALTANVMGANVTAGVGLHAADLLSDLKTGEVLGADTKSQIRAQFLGIVVGALAVVPAFNALVPDASVLGSDALPAPAVMVWAGVSRALAGGLGALPRAALVAMAVGGALGVLLSALEARLTPRWQRFLPSPSAFGIAMVLPAATSLTMALGAALGLLAKRRYDEQTRTPVASGLIAGESVTSVVIALVRTIL